MHRLSSVFLAMTACSTFAIAGCGFESASAGMESTELAMTRRVYVCQSTGEAFLLPLLETPAEHPLTGDRTLQVGLYSEALQKWLPAAPWPILQKNPAASRCPKSGKPMSVDGPLGTVDVSFADTYQALPL